MNAMSEVKVESIRVKEYARRTDCSVNHGMNLKTKPFTYIHFLTKPFSRLVHTAETRMEKEGHHGATLIMFCGIIAVFQNVQVTELNSIIIKLLITIDNMNRYFKSEMDIKLIQTIYILIKTISHDLKVKG